MEKEARIVRVYTGGSFDLFHVGHMNFLKLCRDLGKVYVSLNTDEFIERFKGEKPIMNYDERKAVLESCKYVHKVVENTYGEDSKPAIEKVRPDVIAIGDDWEKKNYYKQMGFDGDWLNERRITLIYLPYTPNISTTLIKERIKRDNS